MCDSDRGRPATGGWTRARPHTTFLTAPAKLQTPEQFRCHIPCDLGLEPQFTEDIETQGEKMTFPESQCESLVAGTVSALFSALTPAPHTAPGKQANWGAQEIAAPQVISTVKECIP